jgi:hypothetical protein
MAVNQGPAPLPCIGGLLDAPGQLLLALGASAHTVSGQAVTTRYAHKLPVAAGSFALTGQDIDFDYVPLVGGIDNPAPLPCMSTLMAAATGTYSLPLAAGSFALTGVAVALSNGYSLSLGAGSFAFTGAPADSDHQITISPTSFAMSGQALAITRTRLPITLGTGSFAWTGQDVGTVYEQVGGLNIPLGTGAFTLSGVAVTVKPVRRMDLEAGAFTLSGKPLVFDAPLWTVVTPSGGTWTPVAAVETEWQEAA